jgi:uncharacterized protein YecE (DUF72 family)
LQILVGTGGWDYLPVETDDRLREYAKLFSFVEVNSTFYRYPRLSTVRSWRRRVPSDFVFSVKCHRDATHVYQFKPVDGTFKALEYMFEVCRLLRSDMLVLQTPADMVFDDVTIGNVGKLLKMMKPSDLNLIWEVRRPRGSEISGELSKVMKDLGVMRAVDLTREEPPEGQDIVYSRLFGSAGGGVKPFSEKEIDDVIRRVSVSGASREVLSFHGVHMYKDALELKKRIKN